MIISNNQEIDAILLIKFINAFAKSEHVDIEQVVVCFDDEGMIFKTKQQIEREQAEEKANHKVRLAAILNGK